MSALAPLVNSLMSGNLNDAINPVTDKTMESTKIVKKYYSDGYSYEDHHGSYGHHHPQTYGRGKGSKKSGRSVALSALTLLAFLFFLHILQQCLQDQMDNMTPQMVVMQATINAAREAEAKLKEAQKRVGEGAQEDKKDPGEIDTGFASQKRFDDLYIYDKIPTKMNTKGGFSNP
ncbi:unnamed protein product [Callosobruchus maculatus]|uniref:Uncharacterized protein n=1 Tax=Callosobruchus maculatus TaxID=64391 RepID=A0A653CLE7_CALMS|nr:unnamed protein product [Callosobruchus maculatus]